MPPEPDVSYPFEYVKKTKANNGRKVLLRPIKPSDNQLEKDMIQKLSEESIYFRFFGHFRKFTDEFISRFTHIDYRQEIAIIALLEEHEKAVMAGVVRVVLDKDTLEEGEFALVIADPYQGIGLGSILTDYILEICKSRGVKRVYASMLWDNEGMKKIFARRGFGFTQEDYLTYFVEKFL